MNLLSKIADRAAAARLSIMGIAPVLPTDGLHEGIRSVVLLGPDEPTFWEHFTSQPEYIDDTPDALDRWSRRVIGRMACDLGAKAVFPFGGPPHRPFISWALRTGRAHTSPVGMLVHDKAGLFFSVRGGIALTDVIETELSGSPCLGCANQPCRTACPAGALTPQGYDVPACHSFLDTDPGQGCMVGGCHVRRACPVGQDQRKAAQSAFHMKAFHRK